MFGSKKVIKNILGTNKISKDKKSRNNQDEFYSKTERTKLLNKKFHEMQKKYPNLNPDNPVDREKLLQLMEKERTEFKLKGIEEYWLEPHLLKR